MRGHKGQEYAALFRKGGFLEPDGQRILSPKFAELISKRAQARDQHFNIVTHTLHCFAGHSGGIGQEWLMANRLPLYKQLVPHLLVFPSSITIKKTAHIPSLWLIALLAFSENCSLSDINEWKPNDSASH